jgi:aarF domain-containing kinase
MWAKPRLLVMEYIPGKRLDDLGFLDSNHISRDEVSASLARIFNTMIFGSNAPLHCDPHGGNLAIRLNNNRRKPQNFDIILYDHGLYRDIPQDLRRSYAKLWLAVIDSDMPKMQRYAKEVAGITEEQFPLFASAITGRDFTTLTKGVATQRSDDEKKVITEGTANSLLPFFLLSNAD